MPTYKVTDPNTGRTVRLTGDSPPTEAELEEVFASIGGSQGKQQTPAMQATIGPERPLTMGETLGGAVRNFPSSAGQLAKDVAQPFMHPIETGKAMYSLGKGILQKLIPGEQADEATADAVGTFFADRYGGIENVKRTFAEDPAGFLADASMLLTGGGTAAARAPGVIGKAGQAVKAAGQAIDPMQAAVRAGRGAGKLASGTAREVLGKTTGQEGGVLSEAYTAGRAGDPAFKRAYAGKTEGSELATKARDALKQMRQSKQAGYATAEGQWMQDQTAIDFKPIMREYNKINESMGYRGKRKVGPRTEKVLGEIKAQLEDWGADPSYHNAAGLDALKQRLDDIDFPPDNEQAQRAVTAVRNRVKQQIVDTVPQYAEAMKQYEEMHNLEKEIERALSLKDNTSIDTTLRKLQSVLRDNVQTNYGNRLKLAQELSKHGGEDLLPAIAGQSLSKLTPRGMQSLVATGSLGAALSNPLYLGYLPLSSPKLMGGAAYGAGVASRLADQLRLGLGVAPGAGQAYFQTGRLADELQRRR